MDTLSPETVETIRLVVSLAIPILVGLLSKSSASSGLKSTINVVLVALNTAIATVLSDASADLNVVVRDFIETAVVSFATYYGLWKPTGIAGTVAAKTPRFGFGPEPDLTTDEKGLEEVVVPPPVMEAAMVSPAMSPERADLMHRADVALGEAAMEFEGVEVVDPTPVKKVTKKKAPAKKAAAKKATPRKRL